MVVERDEIDLEVVEGGAWGIMPLWAQIRAIKEYGGEGVVMNWQVAEIYTEANQQAEQIAQDYDFGIG